MFGCNAEDSIEHYGVCTHIARFGRTRLQLPVHEHPPNRLEAFLLLDTGLRSISDNKDYLARRALLTACAYLTHCHWRHAAYPTGDTVMQIMQQTMRDLQKHD